MRALRIAVALLTLTPLAAGAQSRVAGRVARIVGGDTLSVPGISVVLHRVGQRVQGPVDTAVADPGGRFAFRFTADTSAAYLLSSRYGGIEYFSQPVATNPSRPDTGIVVIVTDTSSLVPVVVRQRTILVGAPDQTGTRTVLDWFVLSNPGAKGKSGMTYSNDVSLEQLARQLRREVQRRIEARDPLSRWEVRRGPDPVNAMLCEHVHLASYRFGPDASCSHFFPSRWSG